jgi:hypothetical protein
MDIAVYVATTAGPVRVERIVVEDAPLSQVYQGHTYRPLEPVSAAYGDFVGSGGPVEKAFGPFESRSFRLEVSGPIGSGNSWELAFFVAHGLARAGRLAPPGGAATHALLLTGQVDVDLKVQPVGHIAEKIAAAQGLFDECQAGGIAISIFLPADDAPAAPDRRAAGRQIVGIVDAPQVLDNIGIALEAAPGTSGAVPGVCRSASAARRLGVAGALVGAALVGGYFAMNGPDAQPPGSQSALPAVAGAGRLILSERRAPDGHGCAEVQFGKIEGRLVPVPVTAGADGGFATSRLDGLCGLQFALAFERQAGASKHFGAGYLDVAAGRYLEAATNGRDAGGIVVLSSEKSWKIDLPRRMDGPLVYRLVVAVGAQSVEADLAWLREQSDWQNSVTALARRGIQILTAAHRVEP